MSARARSPLTDWSIPVGKKYPGKGKIGTAGGRKPASAGGSLPGRKTTLPPQPKPAT